MTNTDLTRRQMVEQQVRTWDVFDEEVLEAISSIPRENYVPAELLHCAYADAEIPLAHGQCMLRPSIVGRILQAVRIRPGDSVLEIGTGTGYLTHCLAKTAAAVKSVDLYKDFIDAARFRLADAELANVTLEQMDATTGLPPGEFDVIVVTAALREPDERMTGALKPGGRMFAVIGRSPVMTATLFTRTDDGRLETEALFETNIPPMVTAAEPRIFSF